MSHAVHADFHEEKIRAVHHSPVIVVAPDAPVREVVHKMQDKSCGCAVILDEGGVRGVFTERVVLNQVVSDPASHDRPVSAYMDTQAPVVHPEDTVAVAIRHMDQADVRHLPIVDGPNVIGVLSVRDVIHLVAEYYPTEVLNLPPRLRQQMGNVDGA